jgi:hypothetical protein
MARTITEILKDADSAKDLQSLISLWNEVAKNKYEYPLIQIRFANEHIRELALKSKGEDIEKGLFYFALEKQI